MPHYAATWLRRTRKEYAAAERAYREAWSLKPYQVWRLRPVVQMQIAQGELDEAEANLKTVLEQRPGTPGVIYLQGVVAYQRGQYQRAYDTVQPLLGGRVDEPGALFIAGASAYFLDQYEQARQLLTLYLDRRPGIGLRHVCLPRPCCA